MILCNNLRNKKGSLVFQNQWVIIFQTLIAIAVADLLSKKI